MTKKITLDIYRSRILAVVEHIWNHIDGNLDVNTLADVACFSPYHFHRIYREIMHENVANTVRRLRLHYAATKLLRSDAKIDVIARKASFGSIESFSRAFRKEYGETPSSFRNTSHSWQPVDNQLPLQRNYAMNYAVQTQFVDHISLGGLAHEGDYNEIGATFERVAISAEAKQIMSEHSRSFGIYYDDPASKDKASLRSHACVTATAEEAKLAELEVLQVGGGQHAVLEYIGPYAGLEQAYEWLYGQWLPNSGFEAADAPPFEEYVNDVKTTPPTELKTLIYLPLVSH